MVQRQNYNYNDNSNDNYKTPPCFNEDTKWTTVLSQWSNDNAHTLTAARAPPLYKSASHTSCSREWKYTSHTAQQHNSRAKQGPYQPQPTRRPGVTQAGTMGMAVATLSRHALLLFSNAQTSSKGRTSGGVEKTIFSFGRTWAEGWCGCLNVLEKDGDSQTWENVLQSSDEHFVIDGQKTIYLNPVSGISLNIRTFLIKWEVIPFVLLLGGRLRGFAAVMVFFCNVCWTFGQ